ncbi:MAG: hypothetical protein COU85_00215 [Candidatus Portnoybacteria bacterium CG10_big_fil_rev_8_21_14_0_10_44_7]|uniref:DUF218 domain-containing protein n=1 Tax=Candidatus Portnoybacteria bacterium CG10_big_fil_rev_8_21_14_0_10_44_7 TaxID=1974816 RepID=A0A2M8KJI0_9BACT|nr:MAG: hypothetical protein COU85_00215 [Candidatus Portnoybacteria bacterium CG10_big_fil_rev_8_21_14_0_10_44_7]
MSAETQKKGLVAFAFGAGKEIGSNQTIAQLAAKVAKKYGIGYCLTQADVPVKDYLRTIQVWFVAEKKGCPPSTLQICRQAVRWAQAQKINEVVLVAARPHFKRCAFDFRLAVQEAKAYDLMLSYIHVCTKKTRWYCKRSTQLRTRSPWLWWPREILLRTIMIISRSFYKKIAGR